MDILEAKVLQILVAITFQQIKDEKAEIVTSI